MENKNINWDKISNYIYYFFLIALLIWLICFRTELWLHKATFFHDEAALLRNIQEKSFLDLFQTLDYVQCCPVFFLLINKIIYKIFGLNDVILCFIPYIFGIFSIILIPFISNKIFPSKAFSFLFLILFAYHPHLAIASQTFTQYSTDIFCSLLLIYLFISFKDKIKTKKHFLYTGFIFGLFCFFSFTSQFIIFPIFLYYLFKLIKKRNIQSVIAMTIPYFIILGLEYLLLAGTYRTEMSSDWSTMLPIYSSFQDFYTTISLFISHLGNIHLIFAFLILGLIYLLIKEKILAYILFTPILLNIIAQILNIYPCPSTDNNRVILYMAPLLMIAGMKTFELMHNLFKTKTMKILTNVVLIIISIFLLHFIIKIHFLQNKIYIKDKYYYFILTNVKEYVSHLNTRGVKTNDIIVVDKMGHVSFDLYSNNKYKNNTIYLFNDLTTLTEIEIGKNIWLYNTKYICCSDEWMNGIKNWINENCEIIIQEKDDMGELFYVKKIK